MSCVLSTTQCNIVSFCVVLGEVVEIKIIFIIKSPALIPLWVPSCLTKFKVPIISEAPVSGSLPRDSEARGNLHTAPHCLSPLKSILNGLQKKTGQSSQINP